MVEVLVLYYSSGGNTKSLANLIARGIQSVDGVKARIRTVPLVSPVCEAISPAIPDAGNPYVTLEDLVECDALALGSPVRFGNMSSHLKYFLDSTSHEWLTGALSGKPACVFTSSGSIHGGQEACLLSMMIPLLHHGMLIIGLPYTESKLMTTTTGGTPYGVSHYSGMKDDLPISADEKELAIAQGVRIATVTRKLHQSEHC
ncbi:MAG: NAD(P)H:quinone oxidoreductase [Proteobacteria bacterium]|jgi:NAD(P)H dehydrogenase (quinone)|nr:NAD(P)H:quinone oxidoreductase [Pseudomonadota bacterium]